MEWLESAMVGLQIRLKGKGWIMRNTLCGLTAPEFFREAKRYFRFLIKDYGFSAYGRDYPGHLCRSLIMERGNLQIDISQERDVVDIFFPPDDERKGAYTDIWDLVTFFEREDGKSSKEVAERVISPKLDNSLDERSQIIFQLELYSKLLNQYLDRIVSFLDEETFKSREIEFENWKRVWPKQARRWLHDFHRNPESFFPDTE